MAGDADYLLRLGRVEDKIALHEPVLIGLHGLISVGDEIDKIQQELQTLRDSRVAMKGKLSNMLENQETVYKDILKLCTEKADKSDKSDNCPINDIAARTKTLELNSASMGKTIDALKMKGWDLLFRIVPWVLFFAIAVYTATK
jgi:hypothetical protein